MIESINDKQLNFLDLSEEEKEKRGILGRLYGPCADLIRDTRNGRKYSEELWEKVFDNPLVKEMIENGGIPGELDHPTDRLDTDSQKIAIVMPEAPKKDKNGKLIAYFDIINTPCGKIAYALAKYGFKLGISSRGDGETFEDYSGHESVDPDSYDFKCFDLVLLPAVKEARLNLITEGINPVHKEFKKYLTEALNDATVEDKQIMQKTLSDLNIDYSTEKSDNRETEAQSSAADDVGAELYESLQESLKKNKALEEQLRGLQEKLSVCNAKEAKKEEEIQRYKQTVITLGASSRAAEALKAKVNSLTEQLQQKEAELTKSQKQLGIISQYKEKHENASKLLQESLETKDTKIKVLNEKYLTEKRTLEKQIDSLKESLENLKTDSAIKNKEFADKLRKATQLTEKYKEVARKAVTKYIESKAITLGVTVNEIKSKLTENYSFEDIDKACEDLQKYKINISKLPFDISKGQQSPRFRVTESIEPLTKLRGFDDEVDKQLIDLANL